MSKTAIGRRAFLKATAGTTLGAGLANLTGGSARARADVAKAIPRRKLGRIEWEATIFSIGGMSTVREPDHREEATEIVRRAVDGGVNYIDTADSYNDGVSERHIGEAVEGRRNRVFLATKTRQRRAEPIRSEAFEASCERLRTDVIDLYFLHAVHKVDDLDAALDRDGGAIRAFEHYRDAGRLRYLGVSSHSSAVLTEAMERYEFDCVFVTLNAAGRAMMDPDKLEPMLAKAAAKNVGVVAMKVFGGTGGRIFSANITSEQAFRYVLSFPVATANIGITTVDQVEENIDLAKRFVPYTEQERTALARSLRPS